MSRSAKTLTVVTEAIRPMPTLWVRTSAGPQIGFGHLRRCLALAEILRDYCQPLFLLDRGDEIASGEISKEGWDFVCSGLGRAWDLLPLPAGILIDTRITEGLDLLISDARAHRVPVISMHDLGLSPVGSDIAIDGSVVPACARDFPLSHKLFSGMDFMVLGPAYRALRKRPKPIRKQIGTVFVNLGGGNSSKYFPTVLEGLQMWGQELEVIGIPGFVDWGQTSLAERDWSPLHFRWESEKLAELLFRSDVAITAGGLSAYEALSSGTPLAALSYDDLQQRTITTLAAKGACIDLGLGDELDPVRLSRSMASLNSDIGKRTKLSAQGRGLVDGCGADRVAQIIRQTIQCDACASDGRANAASLGL